ncbi:hypothetical protein HS088_TW15G00398 [Tripterygium wilfordii]|uniref:Protein transport protein sec16 n=1 Tax=Tripterygium wilfordii TaxID=458696 RepID=A0A7J7CLL2_TRIWF|nr:protein transport protein SEC16B homolog [Tripterygium wilfordii]XP_038725070.1 protein transport protein SEC16B homolog [Tripterygium wilfordii]XP_038725071.1 protein transport protein SEC16B homolog [Tripterygium wilfordii]KAF5734901.1 hypothetical protein HS088_TW15G00398 [Tripterygium wilfordii]
MASNPPFQVEDQTDEDFFDKLVDDDFGPTATADSAPKSTEGNDSDDARAFSNLSLGEESGGEGGFEEPKKENVSLDATAGSLEVPAEEESNSNPQAVDSIIESSLENNVDKSDMDLRVSKSGSGAPGAVKEVGWNSFYADSEQNDSHGFGSYSDLFGDLGDNETASNEAKIVSNNEGYEANVVGDSANYAQYQDGQVFDTNGQDLNSSQYWENMYPGWKYDPSTGRWYQVEGYDATANVQGAHDASSVSDWTAVDWKSEVNYMQQSAQSVVGTVTGTNTSQSVSSWNQVSQGNNGYPEHMIFDPQYPGWYYDTIAQEWRSLESYTSAAQSSSFEAQAHDPQNQNGPTSTGSHSQNSTGMSGEQGQTNDYGSQNHISHNQRGSWTDSYANYSQQGFNMWQPDKVTKTEVFSSYSGNKQPEVSYDAQVSVKNHVDQQESFNTLSTGLSYETPSRGHAEANGFISSQGFVPRNLSTHFDQTNVKQNEQVHFSNDYYDSQKPVNIGQQSFQSSQQFTYAPNVGQSSAGRPPHALVTFGFGGKLIVMKETTSLNSSYGGQNSVGGTISVLNLMEVVTANNDASNIGAPTCDYFHALCHQSFPGPLVGGNVGNKELNKWIDERISNCSSPDMDFRKGEVLKLLLSLLKIACQHYGKLRSPFGTDTALGESDIPETSVAKLFAYAKRNGNQYSQYGALNQCVMNFPSEGQIRATASEVQNLLVSGRKIEALQCAQEGQLWGPALVLASQLGEQFYVETVKQMALLQLVAGSPLRTLCLLIAGQPKDVFVTGATAEATVPGAMNMPQQFAPSGANGMLDDWEENLAVITANRTKDDELVIIHLGDSLWRERSETTAAHICYLVAEANFESYSDTARLCLIGADHLKYPRTYASPEAIQRTEFYEYSKVLGNSQFMLLPFQPYKLIYAHMLAEVGKVSDSLKYCQTVLKSLKTGRAPEVETWKQLVLSLEERIRTHQQGGYAANLAPAKIVGKLLNFFDSTAHRVVGGLPPPAPTTLQGSVQTTDHYHQPMGPRVSASQSTMTMSSLMPSASMEPISEWAADGNRKTMPNRSVSEPDFGRSPRQVDSSKEATSSSAQAKAGGTSRFSRFGFGSQLLQKTVGLVLRPRSDRQAKLGESNKFYYDEKLKRWVEEGVEPPAEEAALPPPPTTAFQNGTPDYNLKSILKNEGSPPDRSPKFKKHASSENASGIPPIPTSSNQFSARGRMGVRARYVDTFNRGGGRPANSFQSPSFQSVKPAGAANTKIFIPAPAPASEQTMGAIAESINEDAAPNGNPSSSTITDPLQTTPSSSSISPMQRFPSMDDISNKRPMINGEGPHPPHSRRTASWSGNFNDSISPPKIGETKPLGEALGLSPSSSMTNGPSMMGMPTRGGSFGDGLHEVEL